MKYTPRATLKGHEKGIWSLCYDRATGTRVCTSSPDSYVKIWDIKSGKCTSTLKGHNHYCYKAVFDSDGMNIASVGADKVVNYWDLRNVKTPIFQNKESPNVLMSCDFMPNNQWILVTSMEGEISIFSIKKNKRIFFHETIPGICAEEKERRELVNKDDHVDLNKLLKETHNIMYSCHTVKGVEEHEGIYLVGDEQGNVNKYKMDYANQQQLDQFSGHSMGVRNMEVDKSGKKMVSCCQDHSIRIWDFETCKA